MTESLRLANRFKEVLLDGQFIANTNIQEQLEDVDYKMATAQVSDLNTLAKLTFHLNYYIDGVMNVFKGGDLTIRDKFSFDMEEIDSEQKWQRLRSTLLENAKAFAKHVEELSDEQLTAPFVDVKYGDYKRNINAMIEHCYYHFGQMVILKKLLKARVQSS
ncbi:DinB family protein [Portibacter marinus]|uniref:DinB family protein n=1 Tax=Portibacter marinus TaxID=2898660 RepID=UPI001F1B7DD6|nr:DinB family protein [Portibacter marinus]